MYVRAGVANRALESKARFNIVNWLAGGTKKAWRWRMVQDQYVSLDSAWMRNALWTMVNYRPAGRKAPSKGSPGWRK